MPQRHLSRGFNWIYRMAARVRHRPECHAPEMDFAIGATAAPQKAL
jgi:hypothetical protein